MSFWTSFIPFDNSVTGLNLQRVLSELQSYLRPWKTFTVSLSTSSTTILHTLGRQPIGWVIVDKTGYGDVKRVSWSDTEIKVVANVSLTTTILIF